MSYCSKESDAREIVNDAFLKAYIGIDRYDENQTFTTWFRTIVVRTAINHYRKHLHDVATKDLEEAFDLFTEEDVLGQMEAEEVVAMLQKLPPAYRLTMNLFALEGYTHPEIAAELGITVGSSKSNLSKAREKMKQIMAEHLIEKNG
jgi:RNA polymerase sigma-70 factor, ECF subfamily